MAVLYFLQDENEYLWMYFDRLNNFIAQHCYCLGKQKILNVINEGLNGETRTFLQYFMFLSKTIDEALGWLNWVARDTYEFENIMYASGMFFS